MSRKSLAFFFKKIMWNVSYDTYRYIVITVMLAMISYYYGYHMIVVRPALLEEYDGGPLKNYFHIILATFCYINVSGNMYLAVSEDSRVVQGNQLPKTIPKDGQDYCSICQMYRPPKTWHCKSCNACISRRDHHCLYLARCIGLRNLRYYLLFLIHMVVSITYSTYYDYYFVLPILEEYDFVKSFSMGILYGMDAFLSAAFVIFNVVLIFGLSSLLFFHFVDAMKGLTAHERLYNEDVDLSDFSGWKENLLRIFGCKWYILIVWPFTDSPVLEDGGGYVKVL